MEANEIILICILSTVGIMVYAFGIMMLCGKGGELISGYHYEPKTKRAQKYHKKVMRVIGCWYLALVTTIMAFIVSTTYLKKALMIVFGILAVIIIVAMLVHINCSPKMLELRRKERDDYIEDEIESHNSQTLDVECENTNNIDLKKEQENSKK